MSEWKRYRHGRRAVELRRFQGTDEELEGVKVNPIDGSDIEYRRYVQLPPQGFVARDADNPDDMWYVSERGAEINYELIVGLPTTRPDGEVRSERPN